MKRVLAWFTGVIGIAAAGRLLARRHHAPAVEVAPDVPADPATELRERLAAQRAPASDDAAPSPADESIDERRARVHAKAREAIDSMDDGGSAA